MANNNNDSKRFLDPATGPASAKTVELAREADRQLYAAYEALDRAACSLVEDLAGGRAYFHELSPAATDRVLDASARHPLGKGLWDLVGALDEHGYTLQQLLRKLDGK